MYTCIEYHWYAAPAMITEHRLPQKIKMNSFQSVTQIQLHFKRNIFHVDMDESKNKRSASF